MRPPTSPQVASANSPSYVGKTSNQDDPREPATQPTTTAGSDRSAGKDLITGLVLPESEPVKVVIPRLGVTSRLVDLGLDGAGAMEVPSDPAVAGWYTLGPAPGALGPAVIAGHVTWNEAPAVFVELGTMRRGDLVSVVREDGKKATFSVDRVASFAKTQFPTRAVFGAIDHGGLRLITCGGRYDDATHTYPDNVVVFATLVAVYPPQR